MIVTREDLERFHDFAVSHMSDEQSAWTWLQLFELWCLENPSLDEHRENVAALKQALDAMDAGRMRPFSAFQSEFCERHGITDGA